ncbi:hypothetical protein [Marinifilum flexuosum]|uniref:hypothetical protein n=1 Tax=Marinifilum flexuosum TaxID=1117708 RepID=UPI002490DFD5|nr:hypothetical protein [Marinifilum flexuosum]
MNKKFEPVWLEDKTNNPNQITLTVATITNPYYNPGRRSLSFPSTGLYDICLSGKRYYVDPRQCLGFTIIIKTSGRDSIHAVFTKACYTVNPIARKKAIPFEMAFNFIMSMAKAITNILL